MSNNLKGGNMFFSLMFSDLIYLAYGGANDLILPTFFF